MHIPRALQATCPDATVPAGSLTVTPSGSCIAIGLGVSCAWSTEAMCRLSSCTRKPPGLYSEKDENCKAKKRRKCRKMRTQKYYWDV
eukprot:scaffold50116_cov19-Tisochrysis_lutea.AAC.2